MGDFSFLTIDHRPSTIDYRQKFFLLSLLKAFIRRVVEFGDKNYPKARLRGVFSHKVHKARSAKAFKSVLYVFVIGTTEPQIPFFQKKSLFFLQKICIYQTFVVILQRIWKGVCRNTLQNGMIVNRMFNFTHPILQMSYMGATTEKAFIM